MSDLPQGWVLATFDDVAEIQLGRQRSPKNHSGPHMRPYLRSANITWDGVDVSDVNEMNFDPADAATFELQPGDLLVNEASGSPNEVGKPGIWRGEIPGCCFQNTLLRIRSRHMSTEYLYWYCKASALSGRFGEAGRGVNIRHLGKRGLSSFPLPVPTRAEQERIVAAIEERLSRLDAASTGLAAALSKTRGFERAVLSMAQVEGERATLDDHLHEIQAGKSFKTPGHPAALGEWGVVKVSAMTWGEFDEDENKAVPTEVQVDPRYEIAPGDLLLSRANTSEYVGATVLVGQCRPKLLLSDKSMRLVAKESVDRRWLRYALGSPQLRSQMSELASGTSDSMRNISQSKVRSLTILVPEKKRQVAIAEEIDRQLQARVRFEESTRTASSRADALRRSILAAAFSGQLVPQDPDDEPASVLLERIRAEREAAKPKHKPRKRKAVVE